MPIIHSNELKNIVKPHYKMGDINNIEEILNSNNTFEFPHMENGLFSASLLHSENKYTGYENVWVRDNFHIAYCHYIFGKIDIAVKNSMTTMEFFKKYRHRFEDIIEQRASPDNPMHRPHIRFNGKRIEEINEKWSHAQNDALGYFLWFYVKLSEEHLINPSTEDLEMLTLFVLYFDVINYWKDEDSGHWEEIRKINASSIGVVVAALKKLRGFISLRQDISNRLQYKGKIITNEMIMVLIQKGDTSLKMILPFECIQENPKQKRDYDAALLFLIYPLNEVDNDSRDQILNNVTSNLQGEYGIRRYLGDSYWAPDYKQKMKAENRTIDFSDDLTERDVLLAQQGNEAQWCLFDPVISTIYGVQYQITKNKLYLHKQIEYFNRSMGQITGNNLQNIPAYKCPELYYLENGQYTPNDHTPLLWTQANLRTALEFVKRSLIIVG